MTTPYCEDVITWITDVCNLAEEALNFLKGINWFGWANTYINDVENVINELKADLASIKANDCAEVDTVISWVETIASWLEWLLTL